MNYSIEEINEKSLYDYMYVNTISWNETYRGIMSDDFLDKILNELDANVERLRSKFQQTKIIEPDYKRFLLKLNNEPVGIFSICKAREEKYTSSGELCSIYLLNKAKKKGLGKIMFETAIKELKKMNYFDMIVYCIKENTSNEFYKHIGGKLIDSKPRNIGGKDLIENIYYFEKI